jgi:hypothetical protein
MDVTVAVRESAVSSRVKSGAGEKAASPKCDLKELRSVLRAVRKATSGDGKSLWVPVRPGGPTRYDHFNKVLFDAFEAQLPSSIRRLKASKPIAVRTRKVVAAMLALGKFAPVETAG